MQRMQVGLLRDCSVGELSSVFRQEACYWEKELHWDYQNTLRILSGFIASYSLPGFVIRNEGEVTGYCYYVIDPPVAFLGSVFVLDEHAEPEAYDALIGQAVAAMKSGSRISRIEAQIFAFNRDLREIFRGYGFEAIPRGFLARELDRPADPPPPDHRTVFGGCRVVPWQEKYLGAAAEVVFDSYVQSFDARICRDYQTRQGCLRFLRNLIENPACGRFSRTETLLAIDQGGTVQGLLLATRIDEKTGMIPQLSVRRQSQGRGLGGHLLRTYFATCRQAGLDRVTLSVSEANARAFRLYLRMGFTVRRRFHAFVWEG